MRRQNDRDDSMKLYSKSHRHPPNSLLHSQTMRMKNSKARATLLCRDILGVTLYVLSRAVHSSQKCTLLQGLSASSASPAVKIGPSFASEGDAFWFLEQEKFEILVVST